MPGSGIQGSQLWTQRDQITGEQLAIDDGQLVVKQQKDRFANHPHSVKSKTHTRGANENMPLKGDGVVYIRHEQDKTKARDKYMITSIVGDKCCICKFVKNQFRARSYDIPLCDCYPITPNVPAYSPHQAVMGFTQVSSSDESDDDVVPAQPLQPAYDEEAGDQVPLPGRPPDLPDVPILDEINQQLVPPPPAQEAMIKMLMFPYKVSLIIWYHTAPHESRNLIHF